MPARSYVVEKCHNPSCKNEVRRQQWQIRDGVAKYCSRSCIVRLRPNENQMRGLMTARTPCQEGCVCKKHEQSSGHKEKNRLAQLGNKRALGNKLSDETRKKMSETTRKQYLDGSVRAYMYPKAHYHKGIRMRSESEVLCAKLLDDHDIKWMYEPKRFDLGWCSYLPDFYLPETDTWIEVKGYMSERSAAQIRDFRMIHRKTLVVASYWEVRNGG